MDFIVYILLSIVIIVFISFGVLGWYYTFVDLLEGKKLIDNDNDKNEF